MEEENTNYKNNTERQIEIIAAAVARTEKKTDKIEELRNEMNERFDEMGERFNRVEVSIGRRQQEIDELRDRGRILETRVEKLEVVHG